MRPTINEKEEITNLLMGIVVRLKIVAEKDMWSKLRNPRLH